jgi:hypothetical protein
MFAWTTIGVTATSFVNAHTRATTQPITVHPRSRFRTKIAPAFRLRIPIMLGRKYNAANVLIIKNSIRSSTQLVLEIA